MSEPAIEYRRINGDQAVALLDDLTTAYRAVWQVPPHNRTEEHVQLFRERFADQRKAEGFDLVVASDADEIIGFSFGFTLPPSTAWWSGLATKVEPGFIEESPRRAFAVVELLVVEPWHGEGVASQIHDLLFKGRPEELATLTVDVDNGRAQSFYAKHEWKKVAQKYNPLPNSPLFDVLVKDLR